MSGPASPKHTADFEHDGYLGPFALLTPAECRRIADYIRRTDLPKPDAWSKGRATQERFLYDLALHPALIGRLASVLGDDIVLWGISAVQREPGQLHPWHSDIESCGPDGGFASIWIGIEHTTRETSLELIRESHTLGRSVQEVRAELELTRDATTPDDLLRVARSQRPSADLVVADMTDGDAILFDGRLWHGTDNRSASSERTALILQYAAAHQAVRIPDWSVLDWPFRLRDDTLPPVIAVRGNGAGPNRVVPPPPLPASHAEIGSVTHQFDLPLDEPEPDKPWRPFPAFRGRTPVFTDMACHASVLAGGHSPHPPHAHVEEELLVPLYGEVELIIPSSPSDPEPRTERVEPGSLVYYPAWQLHTIRNPGASVVAYLMLKWRALETDERTPLGAHVARFADISPPLGARPFWTHVLFEGATNCLDKLHAHFSVLEPGAGYEAHVDAHDVAIVTLGGVIETIGQRVEAPTVVYCSAGEPHGLRNVGTGQARYVVFEFHAPTGGPSRTN